MFWAIMTRASHNAAWLDGGGSSPAATKTIRSSADDGQSIGNRAMTAPIGRCPCQAFVLMLRASASSPMQRRRYRDRRHHRRRCVATELREPVSAAAAARTRSCRTAALRRHLKGGEPADARTPALAMTGVRQPIARGEVCRSDARPPPCSRKPSACIFGTGSLAPEDSPPRRHGSTVWPYTVDLCTPDVVRQP